MTELNQEIENEQAQRKERWKMNKLKDKSKKQEQERNAIGEWRSGGNDFKWC